MTAIWNKMAACAETLKTKMLTTGYADADPMLTKYDWANHVYRSNDYLRGHVEVVDKTETHGIFILHATVFPNLDNSSPIWGFDAVCGKSKITGAFHDFSLPSRLDHPMYTWWQTKSSGYAWHKERQLPPWAQAIFSKNMVAAGNLQDLNEVDQFIQLGIDSLTYYLETTRNYVEQDADYKDRHNMYCKFQKQNPHVVRSIVAMGFNEDIITEFVDEVLFPEVG
jgi:hypothetical protein